ncbi:hypothetical protein GP5015_602 [gamma proteobacterium HTCC5015]|nr:hypothetical protein GP5015_602 [gamma proteobacterium HTCC5015]
MGAQKTLPRSLTLQEFEMFVRKATPPQIAKLRPEYLPEDIPDDIVEEAPYETRSAIENLIFEANALHLNLQMDLESEFGEQVSTALSLSRQEGRSRSHREFDAKVKTLVEIYASSKKNPEVLKTETATQLRHDLKSLALDIRQESGAFAHAQGHMQNALKDCADERYRGVMDKAIEALKIKFDKMMKSMNVFTYVRVLEVASEMSQVRDHINGLEQDVGMLKQDADEKRESLRTLTSSFISRHRHAKKIQELQADITEIIDEINRKEVVISEESLLDWLDVIVDANLSESVMERAAQTVGTARVTLFSLMQKYCILQEMGAQQVARNPFSQIDPEQSIQFMLRSEKFILDYFIKKRDAMATWLGDAAEAKLKALDNVETKVLKELKKNYKLMG